MKRSDKILIALTILFSMAIVSVGLYLAITYGELKTWEEIF